MTELEPYDLADPGRLLADVFAREQLRDGDAVLALVRHSSTEQTLSRVRRVRLPQNAGEREASDYLAGQAVRLRVPAARPPTHSIVTITARRGFTVFGPREGVWFTAWRYANALVDAYTTDHVLVTEHGWLDFMSGLSGHQPALTVTCE